MLLSELNLPSTIFGVTPYREYKGFWLSEDTEVSVADTLIEAYQSKKRVLIVYKEGWENFTGYHGGDGLHHHIYIGKSTGSKPIMLHIVSKRSCGGGILITTSRAIESITIK